MKKLFLGIVLIVFLGIGGLVYRNAIEYAERPLSCPVDTVTCPDGTEITHESNSCQFPACPPPNVTLSDVGLSFALPSDASEINDAGEGIVAAYEVGTVSPSEKGSITITRYPIQASSTALATIQETAIGGTTGLPVSPASFTSTTLGTYAYTIVMIDRFEGQVNMAYYLARTTEVLRFDSIDRGVDWTNPNLDVSNLPAHRALRDLLTTLQGE